MRRFNSAGAPLPVAAGNDARKDQHNEHGRSGKAAQVEAAVIEGLVEEIAENGAEGPGKDEGRPEENGF